MVKEIKEVFLVLIVLVLVFGFVGCESVGKARQMTKAEQEKFEEIFESSRCVEGKQLCHKNSLYECQNNKYNKIQDCPGYCQVNKCVECIDWVDIGGISKMKGSRNKCVGDDVHKCVNGEWNFLVTCPAGCITENVGYDPYLEKDITEGHCYCTYGTPDICVEGFKYKCMGWRDSHYYTRVGNC